MDLDKKRDFVKEIDDELGVIIYMKNKNLKDFIKYNNLMKQYISLYLKDKSLNAESLQEKSQKDGSNILIAEENQLRAEAEKIDSTENQVEEIYKRFLSRVKEECKNAELSIMNIKEEYEDKNQKLKSELQDAEDQELELEMYLVLIKERYTETMDLDKEGDFAEEIDDELDVTVVFDEDTQYL
ncbi:hypothetical protein RhiirA4_477102 [Rhizophagus irregularis]|uniref:Uncharacterized protein n=1 Tax=Rhizophagus irregularis TaxID=588596 RepID=A0A2I1HCP7_9GLOM|nr:hypothetical protein RhiirA4_477102 [Rhizophagus irregularis]